MLRKIFTASVFSLTAIAGILAAEEYDIQDIGTLQTHSSEPIAINNQGQILGWYNLDGTTEGKHFFVRERDGSFHEVTRREYENGCEIKWRYLTSDGKAYGTIDGNNFATLYVWDQKNGILKLGNLPGKDISAINDAGQVLIHSVQEIREGRSVIYPVIWKDGSITRLKGLEGDVGIESDESYGLDMNNQGDVVGKSVAYQIYKNQLYKQTRAVKWIDGEPIDLHEMLPKSSSSVASTINDLGDIVINGYLIRVDGERVDHYMYSASKATSTNYFFNRDYYSYVDRFGKHNQYGSRQFSDKNCIWRGLSEGTAAMNDSGEAVAVGITVYGERHILLFTPVTPQ